WVVVSTEGFESGLGNYTDGGADAARVAANAATGSYSMDIQDNSGSASSFFTTTGFNLAGKTELRIQYSMIAIGMEAGEDYFVEVSTNGGPYQVVANRVRGTHFSNNVRKSEDIQIALPATSNVKVRFRCDASDNNDDVYIDDVVISAR